MRQGWQSCFWSSLIENRAGDQGGGGRVRGTYGCLAGRGEQKSDGDVNCDAADDHDDADDDDDDDVKTGRF